MAQYKQYTNKQGTFWRVAGYLGTDKVTGKQVNINKRGFTSKRSAQLYFERERLKFADSDYRTSTNEAKNPLFSEVYNDWLEQYKNTVKESTFVKTKQLFDNHICKAFGNLKIKNISSSYLQKQVNKWHKQFAQYRKVYNYTCKIFDFAMLHGYIKDNPKNRIVIPTNKLDYNNKKKKKGRKEFYSKGELKEFLEAVKKDCPFMWYTFFRLIAFTGLRKGEMLALTWNDINFKDKCLTVNKSLATGENNELIIQSPKTESSIRTISLDKGTLSTLKQWKREQAELLLAFGFNALRNNQLIFSKPHNNEVFYLNKPRSVLVKVCDDNNLPRIHIHGFRHTHCSLLFEAGVPVKDVQERLGHSDIQTTMNIYTHVSQDSKDRSAELFQAYINF